MKKQRLWGLAAAAISLSITATSFAALSGIAARQIAEKWVPAEAAYVATKEDADEYEVEFRIPATDEKYKVELSKLTEAVTEVQTKLPDTRGSQTAKLSEADARNIVRSEFPEAVIHQVKLETEHTYKKYEVKFTAPGLRQGEMEIHPETGAILERDLDY